MRRLLTLTAAVCAAFSLAGTSAVIGGAAPPPNDDLADAQFIAPDFWASDIDLAGATFEADETACDETGGLMDESVWFSWSIPTSTVVGIGIWGVQTAVTAAVYGPFETLPATVGELPPRLYCIYGTGAAHGLTEFYAPGKYLVQLTKVAAWESVAGISIEKRFPFSDIGDSPFRWDITWLLNAGITKGCTPTAFCPELPVTRGQMAAFLDRALHLDATAVDYFTDDEASIFEASINRLAASGITKGCTATAFCPVGLVTRGQMAAFLHRAFGS